MRACDSDSVPSVATRFGPLGLLLKGLGQYVPTLWVQVRISRKRFGQGRRQMDPNQSTRLSPAELGGGGEASKRWGLHVNQNSIHEYIHMYMYVCRYVRTHIHIHVHMYSAIFCSTQLCSGFSLFCLILLLLFYHLILYSVMLRYTALYRTILHSYVLYYDTSYYVMSYHTIPSRIIT